MITDKEIVELGRLLVKMHASITEKRCSINGFKMDKALCRDTFGMLYAFGVYSELVRLEHDLILGEVE